MNHMQKNYLIYIINIIDSKVKVKFKIPTMFYRILDLVKNFLDEDFYVNFGYLQNKEYIMDRYNIIKGILFEYKYDGPTINKTSYSNTNPDKKEFDFCYKDINVNNDLYLVFSTVFSSTVYYLILQLNGLGGLQYTMETDPASTHTCHI